MKIWKMEKNEEWKLEKLKIKDEEMRHEICNEKIKET